MQRKDAQIVDSFWAKEAPDPCLGFHDGYYRGLDAIRDYYRITDEAVAEKSKLVKSLFPDFPGKKTEEELHGVGSLMVDALTNPVIEQAEDGQTIKAVWCVLGADNDVTPYDPLTMWANGCLAADFILEDGQWRIWHLLDLEELYCVAGRDWTKAQEPLPELPEFAALRGLKQPKPNVPCVVRERYSPSRPVSPLVRVPEPYRTFSETFSYGI